jgi:NAD-dependent DNA ligase
MNPRKPLRASRSREGVSEIVKQDGANVSSSASKKTSYTVVVFNARAIAFERSD